MKEPIPISKQTGKRVSTSRPPDTVTLQYSSLSYVHTITTVQFGSIRLAQYSTVQYHTITLAQYSIPLSQQYSMAVSHYRSRNYHISKSLTLARFSYWRSLLALHCCSHCEKLGSSQQQCRQHQSIRALFNAEPQLGPVIPH